MNSVVSCPECRRALEVPNDFFGRTVQCPDCKHTFKANPPDNAIQAATPAPKPGLDAAPPAWEEPPPQPRRRGEREDDDERDDRFGERRPNAGPERGAIILALGIVSLVVGMLSLMLYIIPIWLVPLGIGIVGWIMGHRDLRAMRQARPEPSQHVMTLIGMILSIVGVAMSGFTALLGCGVLGFIGVMFCGMAAFGPPPQHQGPKRQ